jgi:large subunit ribosomal protein L22
VKNVVVDGGAVMKRSLPRAMGRTTRVRKRTSHITLILDES